MTPMVKRRHRLVATLLHLSSRVPGVRWAALAHARLYRRSGGRAVRRWFGAPVLVLEVVGRSTGRLRTTPLVYLPHHDGYVVAAANAGNDKQPQWWLNLAHAGCGTVQVGARRIDVTARTVEGPERDELWRRLVEAYPAIGQYGRYTERTFPVVVLTRA